MLHDSPIDGAGRERRGSGMVRGVLFDLGGTLVRPVGGRWNPRFDFEEVLRRHRPDASIEQMDAAIAAGDEFLAGATITPPRDDYHRAVLAALGVTEPDERLLHELNRPLDVSPLELFPEVRRVLDELRRRKVPMAVVTDNWGTFQPGRADPLGLDGYFVTFVISEEMGCNKPDPRMYRAGSDALGLEAGECLFIDDNPALVQAAIDLGYQGRVVHRGPGPEPTGVPAIADLTEVPALVASSD
jgi:putative hydrolase of the HAD superfamily